MLVYETISGKKLYICFEYERSCFKDRIDICSADRLPLGSTPDDLFHEHESIQPDPIIAEVVYRAGLIGKWERGTNRVIV